MPVTNFELKKNYSHVRALNGHVNPSPSCVDTQPDHVNTWLATSRRPRPRASPVEHRPHLYHCGLLPIADPPAHPCYDGCSQPLQLPQSMPSRLPQPAPHPLHRPPPLVQPTTLTPRGSGRPSRAVIATLISVVHSCPHQQAIHKYLFLFF